MVCKYDTCDCSHATHHADSLWRLLERGARKEQDLIRRLFPKGEEYPGQARREAFEPLEGRGLIRCEIIYGEKGCPDVWWTLTMRGAALPPPEEER